MVATCHITLQVPRMQFVALLFIDVHHNIRPLHNLPGQDFFFARHVCTCVCVCVCLLVQILCFLPCAVFPVLEGKSLAASAAHCGDKWPKGSFSFYSLLSLLLMPIGKCKRFSVFRGGCTFVCPTTHIFKGECSEILPLTLAEFQRHPFQRGRGKVAQFQTRMAHPTRANINTCNRFTHSHSFVRRNRST